MQRVRNPGRTGRAGRQRRRGPCPGRGQEPTLLNKLPNDDGGTSSTRPTTMTRRTSKTTSPTNSTSTRCPGSEGRYIDRTDEDDDGTPTWKRPPGAPAVQRDASSSRRRRTCDASLRGVRTVTSDAGTLRRGLAARPALTLASIEGRHRRCRGGQVELRTLRVDGARRTTSLLGRRTQARHCASSNSEYLVLARRGLANEVAYGSRPRCAERARRARRHRTRGRVARRADSSRRHVAAIAAPEPTDEPGGRGCQSLRTGLRSECHGRRPELTMERRASAATLVDVDLALLTNDHRREHSHAIIIAADHSTVAATPPLTQRGLARRYGLRTATVRIALRPGAERRPERRLHRTGWESRVRQSTR